MASTSIIAALGYGSGLDTTSLITQLAAAARAPKEAQVKARETSNTASISSLATLTNGMDSFSSSLKTLIDGGTLRTQPTSSDESILKVSPLTGFRLGALTSTIEVKQLAQAQSVSSDFVPSRVATVGKGTLNIKLGDTVHPVKIDATNNTLSGVAAAINAELTGVTASVVADSGGFRLVMKGPSGAIGAFTTSVEPAPAEVDSNGDPIVPALPLSGLAFDPATPGGMTRSQVGQDAIVKVDGVELRRPQNSAADLIPGVRVDLAKAAVGTVVNIGASRPTQAVTDAIEAIVATYNDLKGLLDAATRPPDASGQNGGPLRGDYGVRDMQRRLAKLTSTPLTATGSGPRTLAEIGVRTNNDGTLTLNKATLTATLARTPDAVETMFNPTQSTSSPFVTVTSLVGKTAPGTYTLTDLKPQNGTTAASGKIDGAVMTGEDNSLSASLSGPAKGLIVQATAAVSSATVYVDLGIGGAMQAIRDALRTANGPLSGTSNRLTKETKAIADEKSRIDVRDKSYTAQLTRQYTTMEKSVSAFKATEEYIKQQVAVWTKSN